jgi:hypothetical protein
MATATIPASAPSTHTVAVSGVGPIEIAMTERGNGPFTLTTREPHNDPTGSDSGRRGSNSRPLPWQGSVPILYSGQVENGL